MFSIDSKLSSICKDNVNQGNSKVNLSFFYSENEVSALPSQWKISSIIPPYIIIYQNRGRIIPQREEQRQT
jgi:hypothetical protein